jgi:hypothetical protein
MPIQIRQFVKSLPHNDKSKFMKFTLHLQIWVDQSEASDATMTHQDH